MRGHGHEDVGRKIIPSDAIGGFVLWVLGVGTGWFDTDEGHPPLRLCPAFIERDTVAIEPRQHEYCLAGARPYACGCTRTGYSRATAVGTRQPSISLSTSAADVPLVRPTWLFRPDTLSTKRVIVKSKEHRSSTSPPPHRCCFSAARHLPASSTRRLSVRLLLLRKGKSDVALPLFR
ncbi:hypothetical protein DFH07DRAFT_974026 [Mycena maculata]|uniref:Uncharacterized protein n=1 Tax=Mycena maculata TaxID=230809 RepID=A0AAD7MGB7_9AGAR|nr:hypothetical protein DFH07DRAFT_974026 [Mycena maculata]